MSRRGVCRRAQCSPSTLIDYLERGEAYPDEEPYGSFAREYQDAERVIEHMGCDVETMRIQWMHEQQRRAMEWRPVVDPDTGVEYPDQSAPEPPGARDFEWLLRLKQQRYPLDHGSHALRAPEADPNGDSWLERTGATHAQLVHAFREPPEEIRLALVEAAPEVYALLVAAGFTPPRPQSP
jgi:hypothetical protein